MPVPDKKADDKTKPLLSIQVTIFENQGKEAFAKAVQDIQQIKSTSARTDVKLALLIYSTQQILSFNWFMQEDDSKEGEDWEGKPTSDFFDLRTDFFDKKEQKNMAALFPIVMKNHANIKEQRRKARKNIRFFTSALKFIARFVKHKPKGRLERYDNYLVVILLLILEMVIDESASPLITNNV